MLDTAFFVLSKTAGMIIRVEIWLIIALALSLIALWRGRIKRAQWTLAATFVFVLTLSYFPLGGSFFAKLESRFPVEPELEHVDGIIILGGAEQRAAMKTWGPVQLSAAAERYTASLELADSFPDAKVLFTGGSGSIRDLQGITASEADVAETFFLTHGVNPERLLLEGRSRNTAENASLSLALAQPSNNEVWVLVTSAYHLPRAVRSFEAAGWPEVVPYPVDFRTSRGGKGLSPYLHLSSNMDHLNILMKEALGSFVYNLTGR